MDRGRRLIAEATAGGIGSVAAIHLDRLAANAAAMRAVIGERFFWAVVKADAYGLGAVPVARTLLEAGADGLAVARTTEAEELRRAGIAAPLLLLGPLPDPVPRDAGLHLTATCPDDLRRLLASDSPSPVHLKLDTGMGRLGLPADPAAWLVQARGLGRRWRGLWTHYSHADVPGHSTIAAQRKRFAAALAAVGEAGIELDQIHMANSAGTAWLGPDETAVRVGLYLYGAHPWEGPVDVPPPRAVVDWVAPLVSHRRVPAGWGISYRHFHTTAAETDVAVVPVGYADGLPAVPAEPLTVWTAGGRLPVRGRVTMDLTVVELADPPPPTGEPAYLLGPVDAEGAPTVDELARVCGRIPYEVLTNLGPRVVRWYLP